MSWRTGIRSAAEWCDPLEGVIVSVVLDGQRGRWFRLVLDAQSFEEVGRAFAPHVIPFGFHGEFKS